MQTTGIQNTALQQHHTNQSHQPTPIKSLPLLGGLHLVPGVIVVLGYLWLSQLSLLSAYPRVAVLGLAAIGFLVPTELGILCFVAKKETGRWNFMSILGLKNRLKLQELILWVVLLFLATGALMTALKPLTTLIQHQHFAWLPGTFNLTEALTMYPREILIQTLLIEFLALTLLGPIVEELYFRGFLMARMKAMGVKGVVLNTTLFSIYHFWSPWMILARAIGLLPLYLVTSKKNTLVLPILVHCLCNFMDVAMLLALLK